MYGISHSIDFRGRSEAGDLDVAKKGVPHIKFVEPSCGGLTWDSWLGFEHWKRFWLWLTWIFNPNLQSRSGLTWVKTARLFEMSSLKESVSKKFKNTIWFVFSVLINDDFIWDSPGASSNLKLKVLNIFSAKLNWVGRNFSDSIQQAVQYGIVEMVGEVLFTISKRARVRSRPVRARK